MLQSHLGEISALLTAFFWTVTALAFELASKKIGSMSVNLWRLLIGLVFYCILSYSTHGMILPFDADTHAWIWLSLSGVVGLIFGDYFLFKSYEVINVRISMLIMALVPPITAIISWLVLDETMSLQNIIGMLITLIGISLAVLERQTSENSTNGRRKITLSYSLVGILFAFGGVLGQSGGLILSKIGMRDYNAFSASQIRIIAGLVGYIILSFAFKQWKHHFDSLKNKRAMLGVGIGSFFGPFLGISFSLLAIQHTSAGIASTLMSIVPVLIIAPSVLLKKEKVNLKEIIGALLAVCGVALFFIEF